MKEKEFRLLRIKQEGGIVLCPQIRRTSTEIVLEIRPLEETSELPCNSQGNTCFLVAPSSFNPKDINLFPLPPQIAIVVGKPQEIFNACRRGLETNEDPTQLTFTHPSPPLKSEFDYALRLPRNQVERLKTMCQELLSKPSVDLPPEEDDRVQEFISMLKKGGGSIWPE